MQHLPLKDLTALLRALKEAQVEHFEYEDEAYKLRVSFAGAKPRVEASESSEPET